MQQLLQSIHCVNEVNMAKPNNRHFESHIFFDGAVKYRNPTDFVLQLVALLQPTLSKNQNVK